MKNGKYGFAIVGTGAIADVHARSVMAVEKAELVACWNHNREKGEAFAGRYGVRHCGDLEELMASGDVDVVIVTTPSASHLDACLAAIRHHKKALIVEKPLEATAERSRMIIDAARENGVMLSGIFQSRFFESSRLVKKAIDEGRFGRLTVLSAQFNWYRSQAYYDDAPWHKRFGSGVMMNQGIHAIDLMCWFGGEVESISAYTATLGHSGLEIEDTASASLRFTNGALGTIQGTTANWPGFLKRVEVCGTDGSVILEDESIKAWSFREERSGDDEIRKKFSSTSSAGGASDPMAIGIGGHIASIQDVVDALDDGRTPFITGEEALRAVRVVEAAIRSGERQGEAVLMESV